jgi:TonB-dependent starch-binding outer membrane protein SusC
MIYFNNKLTIKNLFNFFYSLLLTTPFFFLLNTAVSVNAQDIKLNGKVLENNTSLPLSNVTITVKGYSATATSNANGEFYLVTKKQLPVVLKIQQIGYLPVEVTITNLSFINISLQESVNKLNEVIISSGYTVQKKSDFTGSAATISAKQIQNRPAVSFDQLLGGQAVGLDILQPTSILNSTPIMRVRGLNSITSGLFPLVIVDGVSVFVGSVGGLIGNNPLSDINPTDIESIDVLKDAAAAAIYGSRAANGVIVVTTKKGKRGKPKVTYDTWVSVNTPYNLPKLLNAEDYVAIKNEAMANTGRLSPGFALQKNQDGSIVNTNWYDVAFRPGVSQNHTMSIAGADEATSYYFSLGYTNQNSFIKNNNFNRYNARFNIDRQLNKAIKIGTNLAYTNGFNVGPNTGAIASNSMASSSYNTQYITNEPLARMTYVLPPNVPVYNADGTYSIQDGNRVGYGANNAGANGVGTINAYNLALVQKLDVNSSENNTLLGNVFGEINILKNLKWRTSYGINNLRVENKSFLNPLHGGGASANGVATNTMAKYYRTDLVNTLAYTTAISNAHNFTVLIGNEKIKTTSNGWGAQQSNVTDPSYTNYQGGFSNIAPSGNLLSVNALISYFSVFNYDFKKKYFINFNFIRDGLSALADGNKYGNFGSGALGWSISEENFFKKSTLVNFIDNLKIRGSYGVVGNSEIGDFPAIGTYNSFTYAGNPALNYSQTANPNLKWETSKKFNVGLNVSVLKNRLSLEVDYYNNTIDGLILKLPQALSAGIPNNTISANGGAMYNKGIELAINALAINKANFKWNINFNLATLKNKVTTLASDVFVPSVFGVQNMTREGYSVGSVFAVPAVGVNPTNGQMVFLNSKGESVQYNHVGSPNWTYLDGTAAPAIDNYRDGVIQGPSLPKVYGGFNNAITYKNFDVNINFTYVGGNKLYNGTRATNSDQRYFNNGEFIKDRWTTPGQITEIAKLVYGDNVSSGFSFSSTSKVEDGSYIKLKNISLGYNIPTNNTFLKDKIASAHIFLQAANVFTITNYRGSDPEISINGNSIHSGKDQNVPPNAQVFTLGLNVGF